VELQVLTVHQEIPVPWEPRVLLELQEHQGYQVRPVIEEMLVQMEEMEPLGTQDLLAHQDLREHPVKLELLEPLV